ncbi:hypothetical protein ACFFQF_12895 [Haladaptatus pallidirubidus]|uniref:Uncharacterized protein n=1 Tax=Haladaptatus pallidirubidus TaxID=1008152 RepID=A0AAV3UDH7_9EURY|nr:hypothetical protein [Haladaptatus pallidirubidus]
MTISTTEFVRRLHEHGSESILVRGRRAPTGTIDDTATLDPGTVAALYGDHLRLPLYVTVPTTDGRKQRQFSTSSFADAIEGAERMLTDHAPDNVWIRNHAQLVGALAPVTVGLLEARLARIATDIDATLVTWTETSTPANDRLYDSVVEP